LRRGILYEARIYFLSPKAAGADFLSGSLTRNGEPIKNEHRCCAKTVTSILNERLCSLCTKKGGNITLHKYCP